MIRRSDEQSESPLKGAVDLVGLTEDGEGGGTDGDRDDEEASAFIEQRPR